MDWSDVGKLVAKAAPLAGTILGGPAGGAIGGLIASLFGVESEPDQVASAIQQDPQAALKLKELELNHKIELERLVLEQEKMRLGDVASARNREVETTKATGSRDKSLYALAWLNVVGFFGLLATLMYVKVPEDSSGVVFMLFGSLAAGFGTVNQYFFGSSKSSTDKTAFLATAQTAKGKP